MKFANFFAMPYSGLNSHRALATKGIVKEVANLKMQVLKSSRFIRLAGQLYLADL